MCNHIQGTRDISRFEIAGADRLPSKGKTMSYDANMDANMDIHHFKNCSRNSRVSSHAAL